MCYIQPSSQKFQFSGKTLIVRMCIFFPISTQNFNSHHITILVIDTEFVLKSPFAAQEPVTILV
jgi:hypothetical protein